MTQLSGYGAYKLFLAIRAHFDRTEYDYFKYEGKTNATRDAYEARKDKQFFETLSKRYTPKELRDLYISNILDDRLYVTDLLSEEANETLFEYLGRRQSIAYVFENELSKILGNDPKAVFETVVGEYPRILIMFLRRMVSIETMVILNDFIGYSSKYDAYLGDHDILWSQIRSKIVNYKGFFKYDKIKMRKILKEQLK
jgi:hypothetical protein